MGVTFLYFAAGACLADLHQSRKLLGPLKNQILLWVGFGTALLVGSSYLFLWPGVRSLGDQASNLITLGSNLYASCWLLLAALHLQPVRWLLESAPVQWAGRVSYSFYALHLPLIYSVGAFVCVSLAGQFVYPLAVAVAALATLLVTAVAAALANNLIDLPTNSYTKKLVARTLNL